ncbi:uncharacterized protein LOC107041856 isoform X3 [Diachasma alloeum]|uniref:uncharacterized protein LOC107041856 isoform X3 n=1 Tax=Diachasma alloeum TaxID=454923 RepID=UPI0007384455|nr:uncharacterized protein LOC107041856 isoform X3 [Diachasma alloeum]
MSKTVFGGAMWTYCTEALPRANRIYVMQLNSSWDWLREILTQVEDCSVDNSDVSIMIGDLGELTKKLAQLCERGAAVPMSTSHSLHCDGNDNNHKIITKRMAYEVFLGGSCNPTTWRSEIAIPTLQRLGITYYNPQVSQWGPELIAEEYEAKQNARVLLFVIDNQTRNTASIIEAAQLAATRTNSLVLVVYPYRLGQTILGETISAQEYYDLINGLSVLEYFMERQRIPIFENISGALNGTSKILREAINVQDLNQEDGMRPKQISMSQNGVDIITLKEIFRAIDTNDTGCIRLRDAWIAMQSHAKSNTSISELLNGVNKSETYESLVKTLTSKEDPTEQRINFDQFCTLASEWRQLKTNGANCESEIPSVWSILSRKTMKFLCEAFVHPLNRLLDWTHSLVLESEKRDLYVGLVGKDLLWLESSAVPLIESMGLTLHRPSMNEYTVRQLPRELQHMRNSRVILLIMPQHSRGIAIAALAAYSIGLHAKLVLCIQLMPESCIVSGEQKTVEEGSDDENEDGPEKNHLGPR